MNFLYKLGCFFLYKKTPAPINKIPNITKKIINIVDILSEFDSFFNSKILVSFVKKLIISFLHRIGYENF